MYPYPLRQVTEIVNSSINVESAMANLIQLCKEVNAEIDWEQLLKLDFAADFESLKTWLHSTITKEPPGDEIAAFWFGLFQTFDDNLDEVYRLYLAGADTFDPQDKSAEWAVNPKYFPDGRYADSCVLGSISLFLNELVDYDDRAAGEYILLLGYAGVVVNHLTEHLRAALKAKGLVPVAIGFDEGDFVLLDTVA